MTNKYRPYDGNSEELLTTLVEQNEIMIARFADIINGLHRLEIHLERITNEPIDDDEQEIL